MKYSEQEYPLEKAAWGLGLQFGVESTICELVANLIQSVVNLIQAEKLP